MTYEWVARAYIAEADPLSRVAGRVGYIGAPSAPGVARVTPLGTWSLGIPSNVGERRATAERFLYWLSAPAQQRLLAEHGNGGTPRLSLLRDAELSRRYPAFAAVAQLSDAGELGDSMRPAVPQWAGMADVMGTVFHDMLRSSLTPEQAVDRAQREAEALFGATRDKPS